MGQKIAIVVSGIAAFLAAAKAHGQQLRFERQLAGYWQVTFGGDNPAYVEQLWWRERLIVWSLGVAFGLVAIGYLWLASRRGWWVPAANARALGVVWATLAVPAVLAMVISGAASAYRFAVALGTSGSPEWLDRAIRQAALWWTVAVLLAAVSTWVVLRSSRWGTPAVSVAD